MTDRTPRWAVSLILAMLIVVLGTLTFAWGTADTAEQYREIDPGIVRPLHPLIWEYRELDANRQEGIGELVATARVCQTFLARHDGLARIEVLLDNLGRQNRSTFTFTLRAAPDDPEAIVRLTGDAAEVGHLAYYPFAFDPLPDSAGQSYAFCLEAPEADLQEAITAIGTLDDGYAEGQAVFRDMWGGAAGVQDLDFFLAYRLSLPQKLRVLGERLAADKPFLCGAPWFYALLGAACLVLLYRLFVYLIPPREKD